MEATLEKVRPLMRDVRVPQHYDKVFKDECVFTFDTPFSENGLCVNLKSWLGVGTDMIGLDLQRSGGGGGLYLLQQFRRVPKEKPADEPAAAEPTKLAIGVQGGFMVDDKWDVNKAYSLLIVEASGDRVTVPLPNQELPTIVIQACDAIIAHMGAKMMEDTTRWEDDQELKDTKYAKDLKQLPATKRISQNAADWKCEKYPGSEKASENLWLNLSDGFIGGGRRFFDGSGGTNGALEHFEEEQAKGNFYPLCVKLGTITPQGADVYSYAKDEDGMVKDPNLAEHIAHWGIDIMKMEKTAKTLAEMEVDLNQNYDWSRICESGGELKRLRGPGLVGLKNLGNSCYMNSSVQLLMGLPEAKTRYADADLAIRKAAPGEVSTDLVAQVAKLNNGLMCDRYGPPLKEGDDEDDPKLIVAPQMFRTLIGRGHSEFSSNRQQDAGEFVGYFLDQLARQERMALGSRLESGKPLANLFEFAVEGRLEQQSEAKGVLYSRQKQNMLMLPIKLEDAENLAEVTAYRSAQASVEEKDPKKPKTEGESEEPKPLIQLAAALNRWAAPEDGIEFRGAQATKTTKLATMPRYLMIQVNRYSINEKWMPVKIDCKVPMPESVSLEHLRGKGPQPGENELKDDGPAPAATATTAAAVATVTAADAVPAAAIGSPHDQQLRQKKHIHRRYRERLKLK